MTNVATSLLGKKVEVRSFHYEYSPREYDTSWPGKLLVVGEVVAVFTVQPQPTHEPIHFIVQKEGGELYNFQWDGYVQIKVLPC